MTNQEKWDEIVRKIEELGDELQELVDSIPSGEVDPEEIYCFPTNVEGALLGLRLTIDELSEQELD